MLIFSAFFPPYRGGAEVFVEEVGKRLSRTHEVTVMTARLSGELPREERVGDIRVVRIGFGFEVDKYLYPFLAVLASRRTPHEVVYGVLESYAGLATALYKLLIRKPAILNVQSGTLDDWRRGFGFNLLFRRFIHRMPDAVHAISRHLAARAKWLGAKEVFVIPNGVDLAACPANVAKEKNKIVCVGRLYPVKGQDVLLEAMKPVLKEFPDLTLRLVGDGPEREQLKTLAKMLGIAEHVQFQGSVAHSDVLREIASATLFVGPSRREGQGVVFVEAFACGTPVIGTNVGGIPEVVEDEVTGLLVPPENPPALAEAILKLLRDPSLAKRLADEAKKRAVPYDWDRIAEKVQQLIGRVLENSQGKRGCLT